jgi:hypothetical protein
MLARARETGSDVLVSPLVERLLGREYVRIPGRAQRDGQGAREIDDHRFKARRRA